MSNKKNNQTEKEKELNKNKGSETKKNNNKTSSKPNKNNDKKSTKPKKNNNKVSSKPKKNVEVVSNKKNSKEKNKKKELEVNELIVPRKKSKKKIKKSILIMGIIISSLVFLSLSTYNLVSYFKINKLKVIDDKKVINYLEYYHDNVVTLKAKKLYKLVDSNLEVVGVININNYLNLESDDYTKSGYFKIKDTNYYIDYLNIKEESIEEEKNTYLNYISFDKNIKVNNPRFYLDDKVVFSLIGEYSFPILVMEDNYYGVLVNNKLYYLKKDEVNVYQNNSYNLKYTSKIAVLTYHYTYDSNSITERNECTNIICLSDKKFSEHMEFIKNEGFYTATLNDLEMFIEGKIRLPEKTVVITVDDGYYIPKTIEVLEKYDLHATLFLVGNIKNITGFDYNSPNLEIHSHTDNLHYTGACSGGQGSPLKCLAREKILADLKKSREDLNNTTYFCYPFFEYNDYAISLVKEAGFTMAFMGGRMKVRVGTNKYKVPRYGIVNTTTISDLKSIIY